MERYMLALSGGGFRAALFHIGTLAALAERGVLHRVECLSTVSGGSIIGACYYLKVKRLLEGHHPGFPRPTEEAYLELVKELEREFLAAVQENLRLRLFDSPLANFMMARRDRSRTGRLADLIDAHFLAPIAGRRNLRLKEIHIHPPGSPERFDVRRYNRSHPFKIPILIINATCLNTGHPWHFTGADLGEPEPIRPCEREIDTNIHLPQISLDGIYKSGPQKGRPVPEAAKRRLDQIRLADAVAASAAVPAIFPPLELSDLYQTPRGEEIVVELADGGVFDNLGVDALAREEAASGKGAFWIVSDGSGQLEDERQLDRLALPVAQRATSVMMDKIRQESSCRLKREKGEKFCQIHLRQTFPATDRFPNLPGPVDRPGGLVYRLSNLRTDLDSFTDAEAYTLMYDGYGLLQSRFDPQNWPNWQEKARWAFLEVRELLKRDERRCWLSRQLGIGKHRLLKPLRLAFAVGDPPQKIVATLVSAVLLFASWAVVWLSLEGFKLALSAMSPGREALLALLMLFPLSIRVLLPMRLWLRRHLWWLSGILTGLFLSLTGLAFRFWRLLGDRLFLRLGKIPQNRRAG